MAMTKVERAYMERLKEQAALHPSHYNASPDLPVPTEEFQVTHGWYFIKESQSVCPSSSSRFSHSIGSRDEYLKAKYPIAQYSTKLLALKALRSALEHDFGKTLLDIDRQIYIEEQVELKGE